MWLKTTKQNKTKQKLYSEISLQQHLKISVYFFQNYNEQTLKINSLKVTKKFYQLMISLKWLRWK